MALELPEIADVLRSNHKLPEETVRAILADLVAAEKQIKREVASEPTEPKPKSQFVVLIRGDASLREKVAGGAWLLRIPETSDTSNLMDRIVRASHEHNSSLRGKMKGKVIKTFARAMEWLRPRIIERTQGSFKVATKSPVEVVVIESENIPQ